MATKAEKESKIRKGTRKFIKKQYTGNIKGKLPKTWLPGSPEGFENFGAWRKPSSKLTKKDPKDMTKTELKKYISKAASLAIDKSVMPVISQFVKIATGVDKNLKGPTTDTEGRKLRKGVVKKLFEGGDKKPRKK